MSDADEVREVWVELPGDPPKRLVVLSHWLERLIPFAVVYLKPISEAETADDETFERVCSADESVRFYVNSYHITASGLDLFAILRHAPEQLALTTLDVVDPTRENADDAMEWDLSYYLESASTQESYDEKLLRLKAAHSEALRLLAEVDQNLQDLDRRIVGSAVKPDKPHDFDRLLTIDRGSLKTTWDRAALDEAALAELVASDPEPGCMLCFRGPGGAVPLLVEAAAYTLVEGLKRSGIPGAKGFPLGIRSIRELYSIIDVGVSLTDLKARLMWWGMDVRAEIAAASIGEDCGSGLSAANRAREQAGRRMVPVNTRDVMDRLGLPGTARADRDLFPTLRTRGIEFRRTKKGGIEIDASHPEAVDLIS